MLLGVWGLVLVVGGWVGRLLIVVFFVFWLLRDGCYVLCVVCCWSVVVVCCSWLCVV